MASPMLRTTAFRVPAEATAALALAVAATSVPVLAQSTATLPASKDNTIFLDILPGTPKSNALGSLFVGTTNQGVDSRRRALLRFDVASAIPAGSTITKAELTLTMNQTIAGSQPVSMHRLLADWGEGTSNSGGSGSGANATTGDATWLHTFFDTSFWNTPGGDFAQTPSATTSVGSIGTYVWSSGGPGGSGLVDDVQLWLDQPAQNFGWILVGNEAVATTAKRFVSREGLNAAQRPALLIEYTAPCYADCDASGSLNVFDYICFGNAYSAQLPYADCDGSGSFNVFDYICFGNAYAAGCP